MVVIGVVLRVLLDVVVMGGTYLMSVTLETSQLPMSWSNDEAYWNMALYVTHTIPTPTPTHVGLRLGLAVGLGLRLAVGFGSG